jgi:dTDP-L-rhamnose 4-epimerase
MRILVTGGSGFVGSHVVDLAADVGHDVVVLDRLRPKFENDRATYLIGDVRDDDCWRAALADVDAISHQAARVGLGRRFADVVDYVDDNDVGTAVMLRALDRSGFTGRLVLAGSMVAYGEGAYRCPICGPAHPGPRSVERLAAGAFEPPCPTCGGDLAPETVGEDDTIDPRNVYAATKVHQEHLCAVFGRESGSPVVSLRYHNVYGPRSPADTPYSGVASLFVSALRRGEAPRIFEDGGQRRDFVHVRDVARANLAALEAPLGVTGVFNIASGRPHTIRELAEGLYEALGGSGPKPVVTGEWRLGDVRHIVASPQKAARELGFEAGVSFEAGMAELAGDSAVIE